MNSIGLASRVPQAADCRWLDDTLEGTILLLSRHRCRRLVVLYLVNDTSSGLMAEHCSRVTEMRDSMSDDDAMHMGRGHQRTSPLVAPGLGATAAAAKKRSHAQQSKITPDCFLAAAITSAADGA